MRAQHSLAGSSGACDGLMGLLRSHAGNNSIMKGTARIPHTKEKAWTLRSSGRRHCKGQAGVATHASIPFHGTSRNSPNLCDDLCIQLPWYVLASTMCQLKSLMQPMELSRAILPAPQDLLSALTISCTAAFWSTSIYRIWNLPVACIITVPESMLCLGGVYCLCHSKINRRSHWEILLIDCHNFCTLGARHRTRCPFKYNRVQVPL